MWAHPQACELSEMPTLPASHEMQMKKKRHAEREAGKTGGPAGHPQHAGGDPNKRPRHAGPPGGAPAGPGGHPQGQQRRGPPGAGALRAPHPGPLPRAPAAIPRPPAIPRGPPMPMAMGAGAYMPAAMGMQGAYPGAAGECVKAQWSFMESKWLTQLLGSLTKS